MNTEELKSVFYVYKEVMKDILDYVRPQYSTEGQYKAIRKLILKSFGDAKRNLEKKHNLTIEEDVVNE